MCVDQKRGFVNARDFFIGHLALRRKRRDHNECDQQDSDSHVQVM
jgi:hypothetical protein